MRIAAPAAFGERILYLEIRDESGCLQHIQKKIETIGEQNGFPAENRRFKPHLTIARIRQPSAASRLVAEHRRTKFASLEFVVSEIVVYESVLQTGGSQYRIVEKFGLRENFGELEN